MAREGERFGFAFTLIIDVLTPGPDCSKLKTSLVNVLLKFQMLISQICLYHMMSLLFSG